MRYIDRLLQRWRMRKALNWLPPEVRLIDIGAHEGELFEAAGSRLKEGFGIEPLIRVRRQTDRYVVEPGLFPEICPTEGGWDAVTMLAVFEHIPPAAQTVVVDACHNLLRAGGRVIITVPSPAVDHVLGVLKWLRLIDGMSLEEHYGFEPKDLDAIFAPPGFRRLHHERFQLGLNHLFVFEKT